MVLRDGCDHAQAGRQAGAAGASASQVAKGLLKQRVWIKWPYLQEAVIQAVSDGDRKVGAPETHVSVTPEDAVSQQQVPALPDCSTCGWIRGSLSTMAPVSSAKNAGSHGGTQTHKIKAELWPQIGGEGSDKPHSKEEAEEWRRAANVLAAQMRSKQGLEIGPCHLMLHVRPCEGLMRQLDGTVEKRFSKAQMTYPIQVGCSLPSGLLSGQLSGGASGQQSAQHAWQVVPCQAAEHCPRLPGSLLPYALLKNRTACRMPMAAFMCSQRACRLRSGRAAGGERLL